MVIQPIEISYDLMLFLFVVSRGEVMSDTERREELIQAYHLGIVGPNSLTAKITGGHVGQNKAMSKIASSYYWPNMQRDVAKYISTCDHCQQVNTIKLQKVNKELHSIPISMKLMAQVGINLMRSKLSKGYNYVNSAIDYFTKYVKIGTLKNKTAESIATWIYDNIFCHYRVTDVHITDNGTEFVNRISKEFYARCKVAQHYISIASS